MDGVQWLPRLVNASLSANTATQCDVHSCEVLNDAEYSEVCGGEEWGREAEGKGLQEQVKCRVCLV